MTTEPPNELADSCDGDVECFRRVGTSLVDLLGPSVVMTQTWERIKEGATSQGVEDLHALVARDPAARWGCDHVLATYRSLWAVLAYRCSHALWLQGIRTNDLGLITLARSVSEQFKVSTGVEIHPAAAIGRRLVIDHGYGTVIGETVVMGDDCYLLQGVVLGSRKVADNAATRRHPAVGNRVQMGSFVRVLGAVHIGDDVRIGCMALVLDDVPDGSRVSANPGTSTLR